MNLLLLLYSCVLCLLECSHESVVVVVQLCTVAAGVLA